MNLATTTTLRATVGTTRIACGWNHQIHRMKPRFDDMASVRCVGRSE